MKAETQQARALMCVFGNQENKMKRLIRLETTTTTMWYKTEVKLTDEQEKRLEDEFDGDVDSFLDDTESIDEDLCYEGELVREKDCGTDVEWRVEDDD
jgi:hypothetical protein